ncbi:MAG: hypothetical protein JWP74_532 [Marmoricola sp.]|nr:hypothetical protein [Marmoricola sp.]
MRRSHALMLPVLSVLLVLGTGVVIPASLPAATASSAKPAVSSRPDGVSAMETAQLQGSRVEDESQRTPTTATYANPDGSWTTMAYSGVVRAKGDDDSWVPIDASVTKDKGSYEPSATPFDVKFSDGGDKTVGTVNTTSDTSVEVGWPTKLPTPVASGDTLTYPNAAADSSDLVVTSKADGFDYSMVLGKAPAADDTQVEYRIPLTFNGADVATNDDGSIVLKDGRNRVATLTAPVMWDGTAANANGAGDTKPVDATVEGTGDDRTLVLKPNMDYLRDPNTTYPVTVDPSIVINTAGDTWIQSSGDTSSQYTSPELHIGSNDGGTTVARSFIYFDLTGVSAPTGTVFSSAQMKLSNFETGACAGASVTASRITSGWTVPSITWATQPTVIATHAASSTDSFGTTGCSSEGTMAFDMTGMVNDWGGGAWNVGVQVKADNETAASGYRKVRSLENGDLSKVPQLVLNYNSTPSVPAATVQVAPGITNGSTVYSNAHQPAFTTSVSDPDGGSVTAQFQLLQGATVVDDWTSASVPSGSGVTHTPSASVADGTYTAKWRVSDGTLTSAWSSGQAVVIDTVAPTAPSIDCNGGTGYANNSWSGSGPASATCVVTTSSDTVSISATKNGVDAGFPALSGNSTSKNFNIATSDYFDMRMTAYDAAGNSSSTVKYQFGVAGGLLNSPAVGATSTGTFPLNATEQSGATNAVAQWRLAGSTGAFTTATKVTKDGSTWTGLPTDAGVLGQTGDLVWDAAAEPGITAPSNLEVRICYNYAGPTQRCTPARQVGLIQHAFGASYPTADVGPASVALMTGEFDIDSTDVNVPGYADTLSISRTAESFSGTAASPAQAVFGPGWIANFDGPSIGAAASQVIDRSATNGSIILVGPDGQSTVYKTSGTPSAQKVGVYAAQGIGASYDEHLEIVSGSPLTLVLTEEDGTQTTWNYAGSGVWNVKNVADSSAGAVPAIRYAYTGSYLTGIFSQAPSITDANCSATVQVAGCRALILSYTGTGSSTRLTGVDLKTYDPKPRATDGGVAGQEAGTPGSGAGMTSVPVARYSYDTSNNLASAWDPRLDYNAGANHVSTNYTYQGPASKTMLASLTPPGQKTWNFNVDGSGRLDTVTRPEDDAVGGTATWKVKYGVPLSGTSLPTMTAAQVATWGETQVPTQAVAVFGPDAPNYTDYTYADLTYFNTNGQTLNAAQYGAGAWQIDTTQYDPTYGNVSWTLDATNRALGLTSYNWTASEISNDLTTRYTYSSAGDRVEQFVGPNATVVSNNGTTVYGRKRVVYDYDDEETGNPSLIPGRPATDAVPRRNLVVQQTQSLVERTTGNVFDSKQTRYFYDPVVAGDGNGWTLQIPTRISVGLAGGWSTTVNRFDAQGRTIMTRSPEGVGVNTYTANDTRSTFTTYYASGATGPSVCQNKPQWVDEVCQTGPGDGTSALASTTAPTTSVTGYDYLGDETRSVDVTGAVARASVSLTDLAGRTTKEATSTTNAPTGETPIPDTRYTYYDNTGQLSTTSNGTATETNTYDTWGRDLTQTDGNGNTGTTTYDSADRVRTFNDGKGTYTYTYDGNDAAGNAERRGLVTQVDVGLASGPDVFQAAYDAAGDQSKLVYPNGVSASSVYDGLGNQITETYASPSGSAFMGFIRYYDIDGRAKTSLTPLSYDTYGYDERGRLTQTNDQVYGQCTTRVYTFSLDSDRSQMKSYAPGNNGTCSTGTTASTTTGTFDADDKKAGDTYDATGRTTTLQASDTASPSDGSVNISYYANDMVASLSQPSATGGAAAKSYGLDVSGRLSTMSSTTAGVELRKTVNHYVDDSDSPAWSSEDTRPNGSAGWTSKWSRYVEDPSGDLGLIQSSDGTSQLQLTNMHGDVVATLPNTTTFNGLQNYSESTEYGSARTTTPALNQSYTWLGAKRRSSDSLDSIVLMGSRLYNPTTGRFLSRDPIPCGNDNTYTYPVDPINLYDTSGQNTSMGDGGGVAPPPRRSHSSRSKAKSIACGAVGALSYRGDIRALNEAAHGHIKRALRDEVGAAAENKGKQVAVKGIVKTHHRFFGGGLHTLLKRSARLSKLAAKGAEKLGSSEASLFATALDYGFC